MEQKHLFLLILLTRSLIIIEVNCEEFEVLKISNVPFPTSCCNPASFTATYHKEIPEYTICYRFLVESFNEKTFSIINTKSSTGAIGEHHGMDGADGYGGGSCFFGAETYLEGVLRIEHFLLTMSLSLQKTLILESGIIFVMPTAQLCNICTCIRTVLRCSLLTSLMLRRVPCHLILLSMSS